MHAVRSWVNSMPLSNVSDVLKVDVRLGPSANVVRVGDVLVDSGSGSVAAVARTRAFADGALRGLQDRGAVHRDDGRYETRLEHEPRGPPAHGPGSPREWP
jgi:hypothetical protein